MLESTDWGETKSISLRTVTQFVFDQDRAGMRNSIRMSARFPLAVFPLSTTLRDNRRFDTWELLDGCF